MATELEQEESDQNLVQKYLHALLRPLMDKGGVRSPWWGRGIPGVGFYADMGKIGIVRVEMDNPYQDMVLYDLQEVDLRPMNILDIPPEAKPYPGCLQASCAILSRAHHHQYLSPAPKPFQETGSVPSFVKAILRGSTVQAPFLTCTFTGYSIGGG